MRDKNATAVEKALAIVQGAAEGFAEQSRAANLPAVVGAAVERVTESVQGVKSALPERAQPQSGTPGGGGGADGDGFYIVDKPEGAAGEQAPGEPLSERSSQMAERLQEYAEAIRVSAQRAAEAPAAIRSEIRQTAKEVAGDARKAAVAYGLTGILGLFALAFLSIVVAVLLNNVFGNPVGWLIVGLLYAIGAGIAFASARKSTDDAKEHAREGAENVRGEIQGVKSAYRDARAGGRGRSGAI